MVVFTRVLDAYYRLLKILVGGLMAALIVPVAMQILGRPMTLPLIGEVRLVPRFLWTEEVALFLFIWIVMLGSIIAVREGTHFHVALLPEPRTRRARAAMRLIVHLAMGVLAWFFATDGWHYAFGFGARQVGDVVPVSLLVIYVTVPLAGIGWGIFLVERIVHDIRAILGLEDPDDRRGPPSLPDAGQDRIGKDAAL